MTDNEGPKEHMRSNAGVVFLIIVFGAGTVAAGYGLGVMVMFGASHWVMVIPAIGAIIVLCLISELIRSLK